MALSEPVKVAASQDFANTASKDMAAASYNHVYIACLLGAAYSTWYKRQVADDVNTIADNLLIQFGANLLSQGIEVGGKHYSVAPSEPCTISGDALSSATAYEGCILTVRTDMYTIGSGPTTAYSIFIPYVEIAAMNGWTLRGGAIA